MQACNARGKGDSHARPQPVGPIPFTLTQPDEPPPPGPEGQPGYGAGTSEGPDNPFEVTDGTPQENGGVNPWAPGYYDNGWF